MGKAKKTRKFALKKRIITNKDMYVRTSFFPPNVERFYLLTCHLEKRKKRHKLHRKVILNWPEACMYYTIHSAPHFDILTCSYRPQVSSALFFQYNEAIKPPYQILIDTNFINFSIQKKIDIVRGMMDSLYAKCIPMITECVIAELEKLGPKYRIALKLAKDPRIKRLTCSHKGTYADDCLVHRVMQHKCYIVATNDADLKRRIRKVPGIPILSVGSHSYVIERLPDVF